MKQLLPFIVFVFLSLTATAQLSVEINPDDLNYSFEYDASDVDVWNQWTEPIAHSSVINTSDQTISLRWEIEVIGGSSCPAEWEYRVCDNTQCYPTFVSSNVNPGAQPNIPVVLQPGDTTLLDVHALPRMVAGCCTARIHFSDVSDPNNEVEITSVDYKICVDALTSVSEKQRTTLKVFPNPTADYIRVSNNNFVKQLWISNILGKRVRTFSTFSNGQYDVSDLPDGIYLVSMVDGHNKVIKTVRISKRNIRP